MAANLCVSKFSHNPLERDSCWLVTMDENQQSFLLYFTDYLLAPWTKTSSRVLRLSICQTALESLVFLFGGAGHRPSLKAAAPLLCRT